jgi:hypothetical protein
MDNKETVRASAAWKVFIVALYVGVSVWVNWSIAGLPAKEIFGVEVPPGLFAVGAIFVLRDFTHRAVGRWVLPWTLVGALLSYFVALPKVAIASGISFFISEGVDHLVYKKTRRKLEDRIVLSSAVAVPIDGAVFLTLAGINAPGLFVIHCITKMTASFGMWGLLKAFPHVAPKPPVPAE